MANIPAKIERIIEKYFKALKQNKIPLSNAFLFGSFAKGNYDDWSDIDIALVSDIFEGNRIIDRNKIRKITLSVSSKIEVIPFNPKDFNKDDPLAKEIIETGKKII